MVKITKEIKMTKEEKITQDAEIYAKVYGKMINTVLPAFYEAVDELHAKNYPHIGDFMINSLAGVTSTVLKDSVSTTAKETGIPLTKARKKVLKRLNALNDLFIRRLYETENDEKYRLVKD